MKKIKDIVLPDNYRALLEEVSADISSVIGSDLAGIILYGSYSRGDYDSESDIDLLIMVTADAEKYKPLVNEISGKILAEHCILISMIVISESFFNDCSDIMDLFINVKAEGVVLV